MSRFVAALSVCLIGVAFCVSASAEEATCARPPEFVGCPSGAVPFSVTGDGARAGQVVYLNFGDELVVSGGEGGLEAVTIWGIDSCGLWLQFGQNGGYVADPKPPVQAPTYRAFPAIRQNVYKVEVMGFTFQLKQVFPGRFKVTLLKDIPAFQGE